MKVSEQEVEHVAALAHLELTREERDRMVRDLNSILEHIEMLNELDTTGVPEMTQMSESSAASCAELLRTDERVPSLDHDQAMSNAPQSDGKFFKVPKVIER